LIAIIDTGCLSSCGGDSPTATNNNNNGGTKPDTTTNTTPGQNFASDYYLRSVTFNGTKYPFQVYVPAGYSPTKKWPAVVFLHGGNDVGSDGFKPIGTGLGPYINNHRADFPAIAIFPQMSAEGNGVGRANYISTVIMSLDSAIKEFHGIDPTRIYLTGLSFGGIQGFEIAFRNPTRFAAFVPISAFLCNTCITGVPGQPQLAYDLYSSTLPTMPFWQFQGDQDAAIPTNEVLAFKAVYERTDVNAKWTIYPGATHDTTYPKAYGTQALWDWLWAQHR
jgi:predicted peptidase